MSKVGLVLTAGGARAAYQGGVLKAISEITGPRVTASPFKILTGISAGAINAAYLATRADDFYQATQDCFKLWKDLKPDHILKTDLLSLTLLTAKWIRDLGLGVSYLGRRANFMLDT